MVRFKVDLSEPGLPTEALCDSFGPGQFDIVSILVGSNEKQKQKQLPLRHLRVIPYFAKAFDGNFLERDTKTIELLDEDLEAFDNFIHWLYRGWTSQELKSIQDGLVLWTAFFLMVDKWCLTDLSKIVVKHISNLLQDGFKTGLHHTALSICLIKSKDHAVRYLFVHSVCLYWNQLWPAKLMDSKSMPDFASEYGRWEATLKGASFGGFCWTEQTHGALPEAQAHPADKVIIPLLFGDEAFPEYKYLNKIVPKAEERRAFIRNFLKM